VYFPLCIDVYGSPDLALVVRWGVFYIFYDSGSFLLFFILIFKHGGLGGGNLGKIVGLASA